MSIIKTVFNFYINSSIHVALAVCALCGITVLTEGFEFSFEFFALIFLATITGYNFVKYAGIAKLHHISLTPALKTIQVFSLLCFLGLITLVWKLPTPFIVACSVLGIFTLLYALPIFPNGKNLRMFGGLKIFLIATVWACVSGLLPLYYFERPIAFDNYIMTLQFGLFVMSITLPFDIRDLQYDSLDLNTIPQRIGVRKTKVLGICCLTLIVLLEFFKDNLHFHELLALIVMCIIASLTVVFSKTNQGKYYSSFWVESLPIVWCGLLILISRF